MKQVVWGQGIWLLNEIFQIKFNKYINKYVFTDYSKMQFTKRSMPLSWTNRDIVSLAMSKWSSPMFCHVKS